MTRHIFRLCSRYTGYLFVAPWKVIRHSINSSGPGRHKSFTHNEHRASAVGRKFRAEKRSAHVSAHLLSQAQGGLFWLYLFVTERILTETVWNARRANVCSLQSLYYYNNNYYYYHYHYHYHYYYIIYSILFFVFFFSSLENYFGFRAINVKGKTDLCVSLKWNRKFWTFTRRRVFLWLCMRLICDWLKPACILLLIVTVTFSKCLDLLPLQNLLFSQITILQTRASEQTCALKNSLKDQQAYSRGCWSFLCCSSNNSHSVFAFCCCCCCCF